MDSDLIHHSLEALATSPHLLLVDLFDGYLRVLVQVSQGLEALLSWSGKVDNSKRALTEEVLELEEGVNVGADHVATDAAHPRHVVVLFARAKLNLLISLNYLEGEWHPSALHGSHR